MLPKPLAPLAAWPQFIAYRLEWNAGRQKWDKIPYSPVTGEAASTTNPAHWATYEAAQEFATRNNMGLGFVFTERDPFFFLDIDGALQGGQWSPLAQELCGRLAGAAVEVSQSGTGLHIFGSYIARPDHRCKNVPLGIELYTESRFAALTGTNAIGSAELFLDVELQAVIDQYFAPLARDGQAPASWTTEPDPEWSGPEDDDELVALAMRSGGRQTAAAAFGGQQATSFADLWSANAAVLSQRWPSQSADDFDHSSADQSLANSLAFWTGRNCERIERLMRQSALVRPKWDDRPDYLETTILKAVDLVRTVYKAERPAPPPPSREAVIKAGFEPRGGSPFMFFDDQLRHFEHCVYVSGPHKILTPRGEKLDQGRFDATFGGYEFILSPDGKKTTTSAWEAFTKSQTFTPTRADRFCFRPELGTGGLIQEGGLTLVNTYVEIETAATPGDPAKYLDLLARQLPNPHDRAVLLNYMASCVQNPGLKAQWWPVLQGGEGNGKTIHISVMVHAIGLRYSHLPNVSKMIRAGMNFNGWIEGKRFIGLEEVFAADRRAFFEEFKTTVTNRHLPVEGKGVEEETRDNRANGIITTNHADGVPVTDGSRRYAILFTAQQRAEHLARDGMSGGYFPDLYDWLLGRNEYAAMGDNYGYRVVTHFLKTFPLDAALDPNRLATRAPVTSSMTHAVEASRGKIEQEILEAIGEDLPGFCGGWVSSIKLEELLDRKRLSVPRNKRRDLLRSLGYDWHPALEPMAGRVNNVVAPDHGKPRLFCKIGSIAWNNITEPAAVARAYSDAQSAGQGDKTAAAFK